jgi:hypothetical protein
MLFSATNVDRDVRFNGFTSAFESYLGQGQTSCLLSDVLICICLVARGSALRFTGARGRIGVVCLKLKELLGLL